MPGRALPRGCLRALLGLGLLLPAAAPRAASIQGARQDLGRVRGELRDSEQDLAVESKRERDELARLERVDRELAATRRDARARRHNLELVLGRLRAIADATDRLEREEAADRDFLRADLVAVYKAGGGASPALGLPGEDGARARLKARYLEALAAAASKRMDSLGSDLRQLDAYRGEFDARSRDLRAVLSQTEDARRRLGRERVGAGRRLRRARAGKARSEEEVRRLKAAADGLQGMLNALQGEARRRELAERREEEAAARAAAEAQPQAAAGGGEGTEVPPPVAPPAGGAGTASPARWNTPRPWRGRGLRRRLPWPVRGALLSRFGMHLQPLFHVQVFNRGIEISAAEGAPVRVVAPGVVDYAGAMQGFGDLVVVDHGRGMLSVYGYGSRLLVAEGQVLRQGQAVLQAGRDPVSGRASLYFEIRRGAKAQDPLDYLARR